MISEVSGAIMIDISNPYVFLGKFLAPKKAPEQINALRELIQVEEINWQGLLYMANLQLCTPLWYVQLGRDGLLELLPRELARYLAALYLANVKRNQMMRSGLEEFLAAFSSAGIKVLLLKGAATFCDDLYGDPGARVMGDLDILVDKDQVQKAREILLGLGYCEGPDIDRFIYSMAINYQHHHIPSLHKPGTPMTVEIHYRVSSGQAGRILPVESACCNVIASSLGEVEVSIFNPTWRIMHNAAHALLPSEEFIRGAISLRQLVEFAHLKIRYAGQVDWAVLQTAERGQRLTIEFSVYRQLVRELLWVSEGGGLSNNFRANWHVQRILKVAREGGRLDKARRPWVAVLYYYLSFPAWVWRNICYIEGRAGFDRYLYLFLKKNLHRGFARKPS
jgi:hypothetical protein